MYHAGQDGLGFLLKQPKWFQIKSHGVIKRRQHAEKQHNEWDKHTNPSQPCDHINVISSNFQTKNIKHFVSLSHWFLFALGSSCVFLLAGWTTHLKNMLVTQGSGLKKNPKIFGLPPPWQLWLLTILISLTNASLNPSSLSRGYVSGRWFLSLGQGPWASPTLCKAVRPL